MLVSLANILVTSILTTIPFGRRRIGAGHPVVIIAEIGINHEGDEALCAALIEAAAKAGADAIKLQTVDPDESYTPATHSHKLFSRARLSREATSRMFDYARRLGVEPFTTCGDPATLEWVERLDPAAHKISSGLLTFALMIRRAASTSRTLLVSTGMATLGEVDEVVIQASGAPLGLFQCTSLYPAPEETLNLRVIETLRLRYRLPVGLSDHALAWDVPAMAVAAGAAMIEKHFTLDARRPDFDHRIALEPSGFAQMVAAVRRAERLLGSAEKGPVAGEMEMRARARRSLVVRRPMRAGETIAADDVAVLRTLASCTGLAPICFDRVVGRRLALDLAAFDAITAESIEGDL